MLKPTFTASIVGLLLLGVNMVSCRSEDGGQDTSPRTHSIEIEDFAFMPATLEVSRGDSIRWINKDFVSHTATDTSNQWDSEQLSEGQFWVMAVDSSFTFYCIYHPSMRGNIYVVD